MIQVVPVETKKQQREFVKFPLKLYPKKSLYVPALYGDELKIFTDKCTYSDVAHHKCFLAYKDGKIAGRIQIIIQHQYNEIHKEKCARFSRIHFINDLEVVKALFKAGEEWARSEGMDTVRGPLNFSDLEREGLLVWGFDQPCCFEEEYNYDYYEDLITKCGYKTEVEWVEAQIRASKDPAIAPKIKRIADHVMKINNLHFIDTNMPKGKYIDKIKDGFFATLDETYKEIYGVVPYTQKMKDSLEAQFRLLIAAKYVPVLVDENERIVGVAFVIPSIQNAVRKCRGHLTPLGILRILKAVHKPRVIDFALIGVIPEYQSKGVSAVFLNKLIEMLSSGDVDYGETLLNLTTNHQVLSQWQYFDRYENKRRRCYIKSI